jgi:hypothetical protein
LDFDISPDVQHLKNSPSICGTLNPNPQSPYANANISEIGPELGDRMLHVIQDHGLIIRPFPVQLKSDRTIGQDSFQKSQSQISTKKWRSNEKSGFPDIELGGSNESQSQLENNDNGETTRHAGGRTSSNVKNNFNIPGVGLFQKHSNLNHENSGGRSVEEEETMSNFFAAKN